MPSRPAPLRLLLRPLLRRSRAFVRREDGVTMVEFGILAVPFFMVLAGILETAVVFLASQVLDSATQDATRVILTGQAYANGYNATKFRTDVCSHLYGLFDCSKLKIKVSNVANYGSASVATPWDADGKEKPNWENYACSPGSGVVMVQVYYKWPIVLNFAALGLSTEADGSRMMAAVRVFSNEPFGGSC